MRRPRPFFRTQTQCWYVQLGKKQFNLGRDEKAAWVSYHQLMLDCREPTPSVETVVALFEEYLDWLSKKRKRATYEKAQHYLTLLARRIGGKLRVDQLTPRIVTEWADSHPDWTPTTVNDAISIVQRAFNWGVRKERIVRSPIAHIPDKPARQRREIVYSADDWTAIRQQVTDCFGDLLDFMWETGCRPVEARSIEARHVDLANDLVHFPPSESKGELRDRVIFLTTRSRQILEANLHRIGPLLVNTKGKPWTKDAVGCRFQRLSKKLGRPLCAYAIRHSFATEGLKAGFDSLTLAQLMGHSDTTMISRTYAHLARNPSYLREQARKLKG